VIYFAQTPSGSIKIGCTDRLGARLQGLKHHYGAGLALPATMEGDRSAEAEIRGRFARLRLGRTDEATPGRPCTVKGVRLDLSPADHSRLAKLAKERGLTMASYARMALFERMKDDEGRSK
jgi:hypothetical protein